MDNRNQMGKNKDGVVFPVAPKLSEMSDTLLILAGDIYKIESIDFGNWFSFAKDIQNDSAIKFMLDINTVLTER